MPKQATVFRTADVVEILSSQYRGFFLLPSNRYRASPNREPLRTCECGGVFLQVGGQPSVLCQKCRSIRNSAVARASAQRRLEADPVACRAKSAAQRREWRASHPGYKRYVEDELVKRNRKLKKRFGITVEDYQKLHDSQSGLCAICGEPERIERRLAVDHCHQTGKIRGLLCAMCNTAIGKLRDSPVLLRKALEYLGGA